MKKPWMVLAWLTASVALLSSACKETDCEKLIAITDTCLSRYCQAGGASTALCTCWKHDMVLAGWTAAPCNDGYDNDDDGFSDCADPDCWLSESCLCADEEDNDDDGFTDCEDPDCLASPACCQVRERAAGCCTDGVDNDEDTLVDCEEDPDCANASDCCTDGVDNDGDGNTDCDDPECHAHPTCCKSEYNLEACNCQDGVDNDEDGHVDCLDADCRAQPACWDRRNSWHSEKVPYCVDAVEALDQACHSSHGKELLRSFDCQGTTLRYSAGLVGKYSVTGFVQEVDLGGDGSVDEDNALETAFIRGPKRGTLDDADLTRITFFDDGWFTSNISSGVWDVRLQAGHPTGAISISFLSDGCLDALDICDTGRGTSWRRGPDGPMFYELMALPVTSTIQLGRWETVDFNADGVDDLVLTLVRLERQ